MSKAPYCQHHRRLVESVGLLLSLAFCTVSSMGAVPLPDATQMAASEGTVLLRTGVIVAPEREAVYTMAPSGEVESIHLTQGGLRWRSDSASQPLALHGNLLVSIDPAESSEHSAQVVVLDVESRGRAAVRVPLDLPALAWRQIDDGLGSSLHTEADASGGQITVRWESARQQIYGAAALAVANSNTRNPGVPEIERVRGALRLDLASGAAFPLGQGPLAPPLAPERPRILEGSGRLTGLPDKGIQFLSADGQHVLTSTRIADERVWDRYRWRIYERATGAVVGMMHAHRSHADFMISDGTLLYVTLPALRRLPEDKRSGSSSNVWSEAPLGLRAVDLVSGAELWTRPIRDTRYYGPFPP